VTSHPTLYLPVDAVVFDSDGVLVDSAASVDHAWTRWAEAHGLDVAAVLRYAHSHRSRETVARFVDGSRRADALAGIDRMELEDAQGVTAMPGAMALTGSVPRHRWAVVTSGTRALASARLAAAGFPVPPFLVTADDVQRGKPDPEGYAAAIRNLGVDAARVAVLEDSAGGIAAALAAGVRSVIGVGPGALSTDALAVVRDPGAVRWSDGLTIGPEGRLR
jgi:mannitol-1-/sugar-/sorbitol-6-phosphatase